MASQYPQKAPAPVTQTDMQTDASSVIGFAPTHWLPPLTPDQKRSLLAEQAAFERQFPPLRHRNDDILIVSWSEIQRQFLDLCAPWDQVDPAIMIQVAQQTSAYESAEKTIRTLFIMNHMRTSIDSQKPRGFATESRRA